MIFAPPSEIISRKQLDFALAGFYACLILWQGHDCNANMCAD